MSQNVWLVDVGFVVQAATDGDRFKLDYLAARTFLEQRLGQTAPYLFNSIDSSIGVPRGLKAFYDVVERQGFKVRLLEMTGDPTAGTHKQQAVDEALISQFRESAQKPGVTSIVLTSGDSHFIPIVEEARRGYRKKVVLFGYDVNVSGALKAAVDEFWPFESHEARIARGQGQGRGRGRPGPMRGQRWR